MEQLTFDFHREKRCSKCGQVKFLDQFSRKRHSRDGRRSACKECHKSPVIKERERLLAQGLQRCSKCRQVKTLSEFYKRSTKYRRRTDCIECFQARSQRYYIKHNTKIRAKVRKYYAEHPEKIKAYRLKNRKRRMENKRRWDIANQDHALAYRQEYSEQNREAINAHARKYRAENPERIQELKARRRAREVNAEGDFTAKEWKAICDKYGNQCLCCGSVDSPLTVDHIVPLIKGGSNFPNNLQPLCRSCNCKKQVKIIDYRPF